MKKLLIVTLSLVLVLAFAVPGFAGIANTIHDFQSGGALTGFGGGAARGMCSYCHIPHVSQGDRLWPTPGTGQTAVGGLIGNLCGSCHYTATGNTRSPVAANASAKGVLRSGDVYNTGKVNHVLIDDNIYGNNTRQNYVIGASQFAQANVWPYCGTQATASGPTSVQIECSSCHNPHSEAFGQSTNTVGNANRAYGYGNDYLRSGMYNGTVAFCEYCHEEKTRNKTLGNTIGTGTHPVGTTANANSAAQADIHIESAERAGLTASNIVSAVQYDMGIGTYAGGNSILADEGIGTHLTGYGTGGVTCQSCHLVHGAQRGAATSSTWDNTTVGGSYDAANKIYLASDDDGFASILAIENSANGGGVGYSYPTEGRTAGDYNDLCVDCHETTPSVGRNWAALDGDETLTTADPATMDPHPVNISPDGLSESGFDLTVTDPNWGRDNNNPATWSDARWAGTAATAGNHDLTGSGRWDGNSVPGISRSEIVCLTCHAIHDGVDHSPILRAASLTYCKDCHSRSVGDVSHPVGPGSAMRDNPDGATWPNGDTLPLENYYTGSGTSSFDRSTSVTENMECFTCHAAHDGVDSFMLRVKDDNSRICVGCHTDFVADGSENPSNLIAEYEEAPTARLGSHYTGTVSSTNGYVGEARWAYTGEWTDTATGGASAQTSHWAGGGAGSAARMQCQSCHTPHNAASGLVEVNTYDGDAATYEQGDHTTDDLNIAANYDGTDGSLMGYTPTSALLLGHNGGSYICATCHWPEGTHVTTIYTVPAKPDPQRGAGGAKKEYRDYCSRNSAFIIQTLNGGQEVAYNVFDLIANETTTPTDKPTPESPCNFPPLNPGVVPTTATGDMLCDSCHAPHAAASGSGAFILEAGTGDASTKALANQRIATRNYQDLCWKCHDK